MMRTTTLIAALCLAFAAAGCDQAQTTDDSAPEQDLGDGKGDSATPLGTYRGAGLAPGDFITLTLADDRIFHAEVKVVCVTAPCDPMIMDGSYKFTWSTSTSKRYIRLLSSEGVLIDRYEYKLSDGTLSLRRVNTEDWQELTAEEPARTFCGGYAGIGCAEGETCNKQGCNSEPTGECVPTPDVCAQVVMPVCGCDGVTYTNDCHRIQAGVSFDHDGQCEQAPPVQCGANTCASGQVCCNESCGICAAPGESCSKRMCTPMACGPTTCASDQVCCNESCGICTAPGEFCTQQVCGPTP